MAQYDVFTNPSGSAADGIPYVVVIQSDLPRGLATRLTMPLAVLDVTTKVPTAPCPVILVKGQRLHALVHDAAPLPAKALRRPVEHVASQASALVSAIDAILSELQFVPIGTDARGTETSKAVVSSDSVTVIGSARFNDADRHVQPFANAQWQAEAGRAASKAYSEREPGRRRAMGARINRRLRATGAATPRSAV